ncbi:TetR/AcrR family transcriptional regulator [Amycolatopsis sp. 195334CR]|uniref:TetR/AcrR family transcriptional regulator n=1 Tax=Amycolatopsis sp. 195334CR TaxID=2814588 RepID=UPI001A8F3CE9|nr:TetR/AcrR family transcriptional regulator [Amycolatopsis sp. 195334CR]MBN6038314.1 TetR/AcrR family transcriptional regulator [Amycolatopsis sp. 195334CR]
MTPSRSYHSPRREQEASRTRQEILAAARELFLAHGYTRVTVAEIARAAGTAVKTVYSSVGTKTDVLHTLISADMGEPESTEILARLPAASSLEDAIALVAAGTRADNEAHHRVVDLLHSAVAGDEGAREAWEHMHARYRETLRTTAAQIVEKGFLAPRFEVDDVADRLWFCFGLNAWRTLVVECAWPYDEAERTLARQALCMLTE